MGSTGVAQLGGRLPRICQAPDEEVVENGFREASIEQSCIASRRRWHLLSMRQTKLFEIFLSEFYSFQIDSWRLAYAPRLQPFTRWLKICLLSWVSHTASDRLQDLGKTWHEQIAGWNGWLLKLTMITIIQGGLGQDMRESDWEKRKGCPNWVPGAVCNSLMVNLPLWANFSSSACRELFPVPHFPLSHTTSEHSEPLLSFLQLAWLDFRHSVPPSLVWIPSDILSEDPWGGEIPLGSFSSLLIPPGFISPWPWLHYVTIIIMEWFCMSVYMTKQ